MGIRMRVIAAVITALFLSGTAYSAQQTISSGSGVYWSDEKDKINANFTELYAVAETNSLETTITGILDTEMLIGDGSNSGVFVVMSGDATLANDGTITIGDNKIENSNMADSAIDTAELAADAVEGTKIADDQIDSEHYVAASIDNEHLADSAVDTAEIAADAVEATKVADDAIEEPHLKAVDAPVDEECLTYESTTGDFEWQTCGAASGDVTEAGNNAFTGDNTYAGTETFNGPVYMTDNVYLPSDITLPANSVDSDNYVDASIDPEHLAVGAVTTTTKTTAAAYTIGTTDGNEAYGGVIYVTSAAEITLPPVVAGMSFTVIGIGAIEVVIDPDASGTEDTITLDGTDQAGGANVVSTSVTGQLITCSYYKADFWYCASGDPDGDHWTGP